jgi:two-component system, chemotaxis family, sensor kinase CheA
MKNEQLLASVAEIEQSMASLQSQILEMRMMPLKVSFGKFRRLVRDLSQQREKRIELVLRGGETKLDKRVIEELDAPLIHLLRNAVDHGLESPRLRMESGKQPEGRIVLSAEQVGNDVVIMVTDDGAGIDEGKLYERALMKGVLHPTQSPSREELFDLIFLPGLSTAESINEVSGRGVGLEVVKRSVAALRGRIEVQSERGKGTSFRIQFPFSLAIIHCLQVLVAECSYFIHLDNVENCVEFHRSSKEFFKGQRIFDLSGQVLPLICLRDYFEVPGNAGDLAQIVVVRVGEERLGLVVDQVIGQKHAVLKKLGCVLGRVSGIMGATFLETGEVALVLDVSDILQSALMERIGDGNERKQNR